MSEREIREIPVTNAEGFWIGGVFEVIAGWRAVAANRIEVMDKPGWNGQAYVRRSDAESALLAYEHERFGGQD